MTFTINALAGNAAEILIYGPITSNSAANFDKRLKAPGNVRALSIRINSPGGDVFQGSAIYQMLTRHPAFKTVYVEGVAASMASLIAMAGDRIVMAENAMLMIHDPSGVAEGGRAAMESMGRLLFGIRQQMAGTYSKRTGVPVEKIEAMMAAETWLTADEAVRAGFADAIEGEMKAAALRDLNGFDFSAFKHPPAPQSIGEFATAYWQSRNGESADSKSPEFDASDTSDLVTAELDPSEHWKNWNTLSARQKAQRGIQ